MQLALFRLLPFFTFCISLLFVSKLSFIFLTFPPSFLIFCKFHYNYVSFINLFILLHSLSYLYSFFRLLLLFLFSLTFSSSFASPLLNFSSLSKKRVFFFNIFSFFFYFYSFLEKNIFYIPYITLLFTLPKTYWFHFYSLV